MLVVHQIPRRVWIDVWVCELSCKYHQRKGDIGSPLRSVLQMSSFGNSFSKHSWNLWILRLLYSHICWDEGFGLISHLGGSLVIPILKFPSVLMLWNRPKTLATTPPTPKNSGDCFGKGARWSNGTDGTSLGSTSKWTGCSSGIGPTIWWVDWLVNGDPDP